MRQPTLRTRRLVLRAPIGSDAADIQRLAGDKAIADTTATIPHPYEDGVAERWIEERLQAFESGAAVTYVIACDGQLVGCVGLAVTQEHNHAELGYWIGKPYWGCGYATEAARPVVDFGFDALGLDRIHAHHLSRNPASGKVLEKIGFEKEGLMRSHVKKWGVLEDIVFYGVLAESR